MDALSLGIAVIIYLNLGFSSGHAYASRVPITFGLTLAMLLSCLYATIFMKDRCGPLLFVLTEAVFAHHGCSV